MMDSWKLWWVYDGYIMGIWCLYHGYPWKFPYGGWWLQTASPEMRGTASCWPIPHPLTCNKASMVCSSGLGAWPAGIHITTNYWNLLDLGRTSPKALKKESCPQREYTYACMSTYRQISVYIYYNQISYIYVHYTHYTLYAYIFVCIYDIYIYSNVRYVYMYSVSMLHESHGKDHIGANHQIHRACHWWQSETPTKTGDLPRQRGGIHQPNLGCMVDI